LFQIEVRVPGPALLARVLGRFGPAEAPDDVHAAVAIDVAGAETVSGQLAGQVVPNPLRSKTSRGLRSAFEFPPGREIGAGRQDHRCAVPQEINDASRLRSAGHGDLMGLPL